MLAWLLVIAPVSEVTRCEDRSPCALVTDILLDSFTGNLIRTFLADALIVFPLASAAMCGASPTSIFS